MYQPNKEGLSTIELLFNQKVEETVRRIMERDPGAKVSYQYEGCVYPEVVQEVNQGGFITRSSLKTQDTTITIEGSDGVVSKYGVWINDDGTFEFCRYVA